MSTTVSSVVTDPVGTPTAGDAAFILTADGYAFLVKAVGDLVYNDDDPPVGFKILSKDTMAKTVTLQNPTDTTKTATLGYEILYTDLQKNFLGSDTAVPTPAPVLVAGASGVRVVNAGTNGSNGRDGALFVPPNSGGNGGAGPAASYTTSFNISTTNQIGLEVGSLGGNGGNGGNSYASFWKGKNGGDGAGGGTVTAINNTGFQIATTGDDKYGIFAYSKSGKAGDGGSGYGAPGGGAGGHSNNGGNVTATNLGTIITGGQGAFGIYALSMSNNGGSGGSGWGLVGQSGSGSFGGNGGTVTVTNGTTGKIYTTGDYAHGILAQSIGGSGGSSGTSGNLILALSGKPDDGGTGGTVNVDNYGLISTGGDYARGIFAQSIGGGGGSGGTAGGLISVGGSGSSGGSSGVVTVINHDTGLIETLGTKSDGIFAQSVGGSGGSGSNAFGLVGVGGSGDVAGNGGAVTVENYGTITTNGVGARGIVAQSIGGGGGDGGSSGGMVAVGGTGSGGGTGALVSVTNGGNITTTKADAIGIVAQSVGGGGGNGGSAGAVGLFGGVGVGGNGGKGGAGGNVNVTLQGQSPILASDISTSGDRATGIFAQSVGGGGGNGGGAVTVTVGMGAAAAISIGGKGGEAGDGGIVTLSKGTGFSNVETAGNDATGVFLQSVGGGGGNGGYSISVAASAGAASGSLSLAIGGDGANGGKGGDVTVGTFSGSTLSSAGFNGTIHTTGDRSTGFMAQSVGGGGGNGGLAVAAAGSAGLTLSGSLGIGLGGDGSGGGAGGTVKVGTQGNITTEGTSSVGLLVQSVGGGGGNGGGSIAASLALGGGAGSFGITVGGDAGTASNGGQVDVATLSGKITTQGDNSTGILIQSVGGGGGNGGDVTANLQSDVETSSVQIARAQDPVTGADIPAHYGENAAGVVVQSIGGGGGNGGFSVAAGGALAGDGSGAVSVGLGGKGATGGTGGVVNVTSTGTIHTMGDKSAGLVAQSIGGGGGNGGYNVSVAGSGAGIGSGAVGIGLGGSAGSGNIAGNVTVHTLTGKITTEGSDSIGVLAQSIGGGGGNGGYNVSVAASGAGGGSGAVNVGLGGSGGTGANAGTVNLTVDNDVTTKGKNSAAVVAQAIGGGGGNGGYNVSLSGSGAGSGSGAVSIGLGGSGASGGQGGEVTAVVNGKIETTLENSAGVMAQSIGGGGGNGGFNLSLSGSGGGISGAVSVGLGGNGSGGGDGLKVDLTSTGTIHTLGDNSGGFMAQSIGGGGGNGGFNVSVGVSGGTNSGAVTVGLGGSGAGGGDGGIVIGHTSANITTEGNKSVGILAQSIGGGGGNGGFDVSVAGSFSGSSGGAVSVGLGGSGAGGGDAKSVTLTVNNDVVTKGKKSTGIIAQSVGGGGGNGGFDVTAPISASSSVSGAIGVSLGGSAGTGGNAGIVISNVTGTITTGDEGSGGMLAQSLGGGGGNGGMSIVGALSFSGSGSGAISVGIGGSGGNGGNAESVTSTLTGNVYTVAKDSFGVIAQSLGGGGGTGGLSVSGAISIAKTGSGALAFGLGGAGGNGGDAAQVTNTVSGYVQTQGANSVGILAQSMGGGGGNGGLNVSGAITMSQEGSDNLAIGIGGLGGDGGDGKIVINTVTGGVVTTGDHSEAIMAQSLGGGGGNGGINVTGTINATEDGGGSLGIGVGGFGGGGGTADAVTSTIKTTTTYNLIGTTGNNSSAVVAQSIGGGGGNGGLNVTGSVNLTGKSGAAIGIGVGGFGGDGGTSGVVTVDVTGKIITQGNNSDGILAQSIAGGGGNGGTDVTGTLAVTQSSGGAATTAALSLGVGGFGGKGGIAKSVDVTFDGLIIARPGIFHAAAGSDPAYIQYVDGAGSSGIVAQSIGGGGGQGGLNVSAGISYSSGKGDGYGIVAGFGGFGGDGGDADTVKVTVTGGQSITAYGAGKSAILAQSIGGGGGSGGINVTGGITSDSSLLFGMGGFGGDAGVGKMVTVNVTADVYTSALNSLDMSSAGIMAQSIGGGGGNGGMNVTGGLALNKAANTPSVNLGIGGFGGAGASSGDVNVTLTGNASTSGDWVHGILAQSIAGGGGNGALNVGGQLNFADSENSGGKTDISIIAGVGGNAGAGSVAGNVSVTDNGTINTVGDYARGILAQSIGGGGGTGGMNVTAIYAKSSDPITVGVGGSGGGGGMAGTVTITRGAPGIATGTITTDGIGAHGIEATSIGGGGGDAGMNFNAGYSSVGESGAKPGFAANFIIGGDGATAGNGTTVTVNNYSNIITKQDSSDGILAQSIGGGGGNGNFNIGVTYADSSQSGALYNKPNQNMGFSLGIGGSTGNGGQAGDVNVTQVGDITTTGKDSFGILAQSIGGGGGNAGLDVAAVSASGGKLGITLGTNGGTGGTGGTVTLNYTGTLQTTGDGSIGLLAQSLGNGGGNSSSTTISGEAPSGQNDLGQTRPLIASVAIGQTGGVGGLGGTVILNSNGNITTRGKRAFGVMAQSIGGGGGNGGNANTFGISAAVASVTLGGTGGTSGVGGSVFLTNTALVQTFGEESAGLFAQSIGGGGGNGGSVFSGGAKTGDTGATVALGGTGGDGNKGGNVTLTNDGIVVTDGLAAHAIVAQSIGGGGGTGGMAISTTMKLNTASPASNSATRASINIGGDGGKGGTGGTVTVTNHGGLGTYEAASVGILAQSIGGGGGNGRSVVTGSLAGSEGNSLSVSIGGTGGEGGTGGTVIVKNEKTTDPDSAKIITLGDQSHGILAMSIGGGGGIGSSVSTFNRATVVSGSTSAKQLGLSVGGSGGTGGKGGYVEVTNDGSIETHGAAAHGIIAESIGGGGGNGGMATSGQMAFGSLTTPASGKTFQIAVGGQGGSGNDGGDVLVTNSGTIHVYGDGSYGIYAQSVGGGGGDGGFAASFSRDLIANPKTNLLGSVSNFAIGGFGGAGGDGGNVTVNNTGTITAEGANAYGIFAQSVGGGGGNSAMSISSPVWMATNFVLDTILGGQGSSGTTGTVTIKTSGTINMLGANSIAQFAQNVNGGGGNANQFLDFSQQAANLDPNGNPLHGAGGAVDTALGFVISNLQVGADAVTNAGASLLDAVHLGNLNTQGDNSNGGLLQSIGGGGGRGSQTITMADGSDINLVLKLGGKDVTNSSGGTVNYTQNGDISTRGNQSTGLGIQSIGGGGGTEFVTLQIVPSVSSFSIMAFALVPFPAPPADNVSLGGDGGALNDGGAINPALSGVALVTGGDRSPALMLQSIGAGGGTAFVNGSSSLNVDIGGKNGASGDGKDIVGSQTRDVGTAGVLSNGIIIQSIGGGGGVLLTDTDPTMIYVGKNTDNSGSGGVINFTQNGNVVVTGDRSNGVVLQSLGGGGGIVDDVFAGSAGGVGSAGAITFHMNGSIVASGAGGTGIFAQSQGSSGQGNINVDLAATKGIYFGIGGNGVHFSGGLNNLFTNNGTVAGLEDVNGMAFLGEDGNDKVQNNSIFVGSANFGTGTNQFNNAANALLAMGPQFLLGAASNQLINDGILRPGGTGFAQHTDMTGSFIQSSTGTTFAELDFGTQAIDQVYMNGTAKLAGRIDVALLNPQVISIGHFEKVLFHADGGVTNDGAALTTAPSVVVTYDLQYPSTGTDAVLAYDVNFNPPGSNFGRNLVEVGGYMNNIQNAGSSPALAPTVIALLYAPNLGVYRELLSQLGPDFYGEQQGEMLRGTQRFGETMLNGGSSRFSLKERTIWFDFLGSNTLHSAYDDYKTVRQQTLGFALGFEDMISPHWSAGMAISYEDNNANGYQGRWNANGSTERVGGMLRYKNNGTEIAAMIGYGWSSMDSTRAGYVYAPFSTQATRGMQTLSAMVRIAHEFAYDDFYLKPQLDIGVTHLSTGATTENGNLANGTPNPTNLALQGLYETHAWIRPAVTIRKAIIVTNTTRISLHTEMGYQYYINGNDTYVRAGFTGAPNGVDGMNVPIGLGSMASLTVGMQVLIMNDLSIGLYYTKAYSNHYHLDLYNFRVNKSF